MALSRLRAMLIERLRRSQISDEDFRFIAQTMQFLVYKKISHMTKPMKLSPRSIRRIFNGEQTTAPQQRLEIFERYLRDTEAALRSPKFDVFAAPRSKGKPGLPNAAKSKPR